MKQKEELGAADRIRRLEAVRAELAERQAEVDAELGRPMGQASWKKNLQPKDTLNGILIDQAFELILC